MSIFHGNWNDDPKEFLDSYIQCTATGNDDFKCRQFINYLGAGSDADDWFDELPQEEKKDWAAIELAFRKEWLKEEVISIKEIVTTENEPQPTSTLAPTTRDSSHSITTFNLATETTASWNLKTSCVAISQSPAPVENGRKNLKIGIMSEIRDVLPYNTDFSLPMPSAIDTGDLDTNSV